MLPRHALGLFRLPGYRLIWLASLASAGAQWMERVLTGWLALGLGGDALGVGVVLSARLVPFVLLGLVAGSVADRFPRRTIMSVVAVCAAALNLALAVLLTAGTVDLAGLALIGFLGGTIHVFDMTTRGAFVVDLVGRQNAAPAIALNAVALRFFGAVGAFAGGILIPTVGIPGGYLAVAATYAVGLPLLVAIVPPERPRATITLPPFGSMVAGTARLILRNPAVRMVVVASLACETFGYSHQAALPSLARDVLLIGPQGLGALTAASSIGATLAVVALSAVSPSVPRQPLLSAVLFCWGVALVGLGLSGLVPLSLALMLVVGGSASAIDVLQQTIAQAAVPDAERGRAVGVWVFSIGMNVVGLLQVGALVALVGVPLTMFANGGLAMLSAVAIAALAPAYRGWRLAARGAS